MSEFGLNDIIDQSLKEKERKKEASKRTISKQMSVERNRRQQINYDTTQMKKLFYSDLIKLGYALFSYRGLGKRDRESAYEVRRIEYKENKEFGITKLQDCPGNISMYLTRPEFNFETGRTESKVILFRERLEERVMEGTPTTIEININR